MGDLDGKTLEEISGGSAPRGVGESAPIAAASGEPSWMKWAKTPSPDKDLSEYDNHPLNWDGDTTTSRIIRGLEGLLGNLRLALVDVLIGVMGKIWRKPHAPVRSA